MAWGAAIAAGAQLGGGLIGEAFASGDKAKVMGLLLRQYGDIKNIPLPLLQRLEAVQLGRSALEDVQVDPRLRDAEMDALSGTMRRARQGLTLEDRMRLEESMGEAARQSSAQQAGVREQFASRGQLGSGAQLAAQLQAAQSAAQRNNQAGMNAAASSDAAAWQALQTQGRMASGLRQEQTADDVRKAAARDEIARWEANQRSQTNAANADIAQREFQNRLQKATGQAGPTNSLAGYYNQQAGDTRALWGGLGKAAGRAAEGFWDTDEDEESGKKGSG